MAFHDRSQRWAVIVAHRRAGKTVACVNELLRAALSTDKENARFAYIAPMHNQAKDIAWLYVQRYAAVVPGVQFNESELRADFPNGARIRLYGADNPDRLRGIYLDGVVMDEYGDMKPSVFSEVIRPLLADRQGWAIFIGTPKGHNAFYELRQRALVSRDWYTLELRASDTGILDREELNAAQSQMSDEQYSQEFECSFEGAILGSYYGKWLKTAEQEGRIGSVPVEAIGVETWWDIGVGDSTAIWFTQTVGREVLVIDYLEASGESLAFYAKALQAKGYVYLSHNGPHDLQVREYAACADDGRPLTRQESAKALGIDFRIVPNVSIESGIDAVRAFIPRCRFDRGRCQYGLDALTSYHRDFDERTKAFRSYPAHDWSSDCADAFRYLAVGHRLTAPISDEDEVPAIVVERERYHRGTGDWMGM